MMRLIQIFGALAIAVLCSCPLGAEPVDKTLEQSSLSTIEIFKQTQLEKERWALHKTQLIKQKNSLENDIEKMFSTRAELEMMIEQVKQSLSVIETDRSSETSPDGHFEVFLQKLVNRLADCINNGLPFLLKERTMRLDALRVLLADDNTRSAEKFRRIFEALLIEMEYARTVEVYQEKINVEGKNLTANILRVGSAAIFFQSPDRKDVGNYSDQAMAWQSLPEKYAEDISKAMEIAQHKRAADMITLPVGRLAK